MLSGLAVLVGCSPHAPPAASLPAVTQELTAPAPVPAPPPATDLRSIGISVGSPGDSFSDAVARGAELEALALNPAVAIKTAPRDGGAARQEAELESLVDQHVDLIVLTAAEPAHLSAALRKAQAAGIVVVAVERPAADAAGPISTGGSGESACRTVVARLDGRGDVVIVSGPVAAMVVQGMQACSAFLSHSPQGFVDATASEGPGGTVSLGVTPKIDSVVSLSENATAGGPPGSYAPEHALIVATAQDSAGVQAALRHHGLGGIEAEAILDPAGMARLAVRLGLAVKRDAAGSGT